MRSTSPSRSCEQLFQSRQNLLVPILRAALFCCSLLWVCGGASAANLALNGSFELGDYSGNFVGLTSLGVGSTAITGWTVINSDMLWLSNAAAIAVGANVAASDGERFLDLSGFDVLPFGGVQQAIPTQAGQKYRVEFDLGTNPAAYGNTQTLDLQVGNALSTFAFTGTGDSSQYQRYGLDFIAASGSTLISFIGTTPSGVHIGLDNVVVAEAPEPASWVAMVLGLAMLAPFVHRPTRG
jgi:hypothetical protein